jgi:hypothetical protein
MRGPEGRPPKREPSPEGLGLYSEDDLPAPACRGSTVGAALYLGPLPPLSLGAQLRDLQFLSASDRYAMAIDCSQRGSGNDDPEGDPLNERPDADLTQGAPGKTGPDEE